MKQAGTWKCLKQCEHENWEWNLGILGEAMEGWKYEYETINRRQTRDNSASKHET